MSPGTAKHVFHAPCHCLWILWSTEKLTCWKGRAWRCGSSCAPAALGENGSPPLGVKGPAAMTWMGRLVIWCSWGFPHTLNLSGFQTLCCSRILFQMKSYLELQQKRQEFVIIILFHKFKFLILYRKSVNETIMMNRHLRVVDGR